MSPTIYAARLGVIRGWHEFRQTMGSSDQWFNVIMAVIFMTVLFFQRDGKVENTSISLAGATLPSMLGMLVAFGGIVGIATQLSAHREDGTLLRAKAVPDGMIGYLVGRVVQVALDAAVSLLIILLPGLFIVREVAAAGISGWVGVIGIMAIGLLATVPWGAIIGSLTRTPASTFGLTMLPSMGLIAISGIFYPIYALPQWVQAIAQVFPFYWLGLGTRAALLPEAAAAAEIGGSWRHWETLGVLGLWAIVGLALAPTILRRMARHESGSVVQQRRQQALQRVG